MVSYLCEITTHKEGVLSTQLHHFVLLNKEKQEPKSVCDQKKQFFNKLRCGSLQYLCAVRMGLEPMTSGVTGRHSIPAELTHQVCYPGKSRSSRTTSSNYC